MQEHPEVGRPLVESPEPETYPLEDILDTEDILPRPRLRSGWTLLGGPNPPVKPSVTLWCRPLQQFPFRIQRLLPKWLQKTVLLLTIILWIASMSFLSRRGFLAQPHYVPDMDAEVIQLNCGITTQVWKGINTHCGLDGRDCWAGSNSDKPLYFKCPADCIHEGKTYTPRPVGDKVAMREQYIIGGGDSVGTYRADSYVCAAAAHRGIISNTRGGCGVLRLRGSQPEFKGTNQNQMTSLSFDSEFPYSFEFDGNDTNSWSGCYDFRWGIIAVNLGFVIAFGYFMESAICFLWIVVTIGFWTVILASNPPWVGGSEEKNAEIFSLGIKRLLPCYLGTFVIYQTTVRRTLDNMPARLSRAILWCGAFWCGILENYVFGGIPIDRLTVGDLNSQAGAWSALVIVAVIVLTIAFSQAYIIWRAGELAKYLKGYVFGVCALVLLALWPDQTLRIHHYILALLLLPGTGFRTSACLVYQGLLVGLYVSGVARWDFDSILQTAVQLSRGGPIESTGDAYFLEPLVSPALNGLADFTIRWSSPAESGAQNSRFDGNSLIINDIERYRGSATSFNVTQWALETFVSPQTIPLKLYVRVATAVIGQKKSGSFTQAATIFLETGEWKAPSDGRTR